MPVPNVLISSLLKHGQLGGLNAARNSSQSGSNSLCHIENPRKIPSLEKPVQLTLSAFLFIMAFTLIEHATSPLTIAASTSASFVQAAASAASGSPTTLSLAFPSNTQAGDLLLVAFDYDTDATPTSVTDSQGNVFTEVGSQLSSPSGALSRVYYAKNIKGGADKVTVTLSASASYLELYLNEYSGINTTNPIDAEVGASGSAGTASSGDATTTVAGDIIYGFCSADWACRVGSGFTARSTLDDNLVEDKVAGSAGRYAATGSANNGWTMQMVALKPASASTGTATGGGTGTSPAVSLSSSSLSFGNQPVGVASTAQTLTLSNTGNGALSITSLALGGTSPSDFAQSNNCGASVAAGGNCSISVTFTPASAASFTAALTLSDNAPGSPQTVTLSGTGTSPAVSLSSSSLSFGNDPVDVPIPSQTITLNNTGGLALSVASIALTGADPTDFTENDTCSPSVAAGGNCTIVVMFTPPAAGNRTASLSITDNAAGSPQAVALSGTGTHDVILTWTASASPGVAGYNVYRGTTSGGESTTPLNSSPITGTTYTDTNVQAGQVYYYMVAALGSNGTTQSKDSSEVSATVPSP